MPTTLPMPPTSARPLCIAATIDGRIPPDLTAWLRYQTEQADETDASKVGALRCALFWLAEGEVDNRLLGHCGRALAEALAAAGEERGERYGYAGSAGQVHHAR